MKLKLSYRFNLYIGGILLAGISSFLYYERISNSTLLEEIGINEAERLSTALFEQLHTSMRFGGGRKENRAIVEKFGQTRGIDEIRVVHGPAIDRQYGIETDEVPADEAERAALEGTALRTIGDGDGGGSFARIVTPLHITEPCRACHLAEAGEVAGAISVKISLGDYEGIIARHRGNSIFWGGGIIALTSIALLVTVRKRLIRPLEKLKGATVEVSRGNLTQSVDIATGDELEDVGRAFNAMTESLAAMTTRVRDLDAVHTRLVEMAADAILLQDLRTERFIEANPAVTALTGYSRDELLRMRPRDLHPEDRHAEYEQVFRRWVHDGRGYLHDAVAVRKDGTTVPVEIGASIIELDGRPYVLEIWRDLSERKGFEKTINRYIAELEDTVRERTAKLNTSLQELEVAYSRLKDSEMSLIKTAKLRSLGEMGAGIAHELNSPLAGILSITEVLLNRLSPEDRNYRLLEKIKDAAVRSKYIILDVLTYSRPSKGEFAPIFVNETIRATLCMFISEIKTSSIEIIEDFDARLPKVLGNKGQLMEVMLNIIKNARDAMNGRGRVFIRTRQTEAGGRRYASVEIRDTGPGVPEEIMDKIFDPFFTTKEKGGGVNIGLGLSISQSIVKEHGGWIDVENAPGGGATFRVFLPIQEEASA